MKQLNDEYKTWLQTLGFAISTVKSLPQYVAEMLIWMQEQGITGANQVTEEAIQNFFFHWKKRKNKRTGAGLSQNHANKAITAINNFIKFLNLTYKQQLNLKLKREKLQTKIPQVLTIQEVQAIYEATYSNTRRVNIEAFGQRDRAMLAIYYGCGLRRSEGNNLIMSDILTEKKLIYVRKGKGSKERFVPIAEKGLQDIEAYIHHGRKWFLKPRQKQSNPESDYFFINIEGKPMQEFTARVHLLKEAAGINKKISLHTFRHSIATHLLQCGMDIEQIKKFLGHASLESTQIYTHIINEYEF